MIVHIKIIKKFDSLHRGTEVFKAVAHGGGSQYIVLLDGTDYRGWILSSFDASGFGVEEWGELEVYSVPADYIEVLKENPLKEIYG